MKTFGFIGCGNMGGALVDAISRVYDKRYLYLAEHTPEKTDAVSRAYGCPASNIEEIARVCDYIFLGVKPQALPELFKSLALYLPQRSRRVVFISMAAGVEIKSVRELAGGDYPVIRIMPNLPVSAGKGCTLYSKSENVTKEDIELFNEIMRGTGFVDEIPEKLIDAGSALSGCGPAFAFMFIEALSDGAVRCGLPRQKALAYAAQMLLGSAEYLLNSGEHPEKLKDMVCSPAGSTIEGVKALEDGGFRAAVADAVCKSHERTKELGKK